MKKEYVAPKTMLVGMSEDLMEGFGVASGDDFGANSLGFMDLGGSAGGGRVAFN